MKTYRWRKAHEKMLNVITEMKIKTTMRYHLTPIRMAISKKSIDRTSLVVQRLRLQLTLEQLSLFTRLMSLSSSACESQLLKPKCLDPMLCNKRSHHSKKRAHCNQEWPTLPQLEKTCRKQRGCSTVKIQINIFKR